MQRLTEFDGYFTYDESSPTCLRWATEVTSGRGYRVMANVGDVAGCFGTRYFHVQYEKLKYKCHRIIWQLCVGGLTADDRVDHINGNCLDNRIENLRIVTQKANSENRAMSVSNTSGVVGVSWTGKTPTTTAAHAHWKLDRKTKNKRFPISKFGLLPAFALACKYREDKIKELNLQGSDYTERHGT